MSVNFVLDNSHENIIIGHKIITQNNSSAKPKCKVGGLNKESLKGLDDYFCNTIVQAKKCSFFCN